MGHSVDFYLITDLHHYAHSLGIEGEAFEKLDKREQKCLAETGPIIDAYIDKLIADKDVKNILIAGDVSSNGAIDSHTDLVPRLHRLKKAGKKVYLITATHDYFVEGNGTGHAIRCEGDKVLDAEGTHREKLVELYHEFGLDDAISVHKSSHSYCVQIEEGYRLLCLNDDGDRVFCGYDEDQLKWILNEIKAAHEAGDYIFAMTHHPTLPPFPLYPLMSKRDMLGDWERTTTALADAGLELMFTGHTHMQNIGYKETAKGNRYYDVNTSSLVGYPSNMRKVHIDDKKIEIHSETIEHFEWDRKGMSVDEYLQNHFLYFLNDIMDSAANDIDHFAELSTGFSMTPEQVYKLKKPIQFVGKGLQKWTFGSVGRLLCVYNQIDPKVKDMKIRDFFLEVIQNVYRGNEPYTPDTPEYKSFAVIIFKVERLLAKFKKTKDMSRIFNKLLQTLYDLGPDDYELTVER